MNFPAKRVISRNRVKFRAADLRIKNMTTTPGVAPPGEGCCL